MACRVFFGDDRGGVVIDWVVLTATIVLLGFVLSMSIMENSSGYLMDEFAAMNQQSATNGVAVSQLDTPAQAPVGQGAKFNN